MAVVQRTPLPGSPDALALSRTTLFVVCQEGPALVEVDTTAGSVRKREILGRQAQLYDQANLDIALGDHVAWVTSFSENLVYRVTVG